MSNPDETLQQMLDRHEVERLQDKINPPKTDIETLWQMNRSLTRTAELHEALIAMLIEGQNELREQLESLTDGDH